MGVGGRGRRGILLVGSNPISTEDAQGKHMIGPAGEFLEKSLADIGIDMRRDCWMTNSLICRTQRDKRPTNLQIDYCRANLFNTIENIQPTVIVPMGNAAVASLLTRMWKESPGGIERWAGWQIPGNDPNAWICPTYNPEDFLGEKNPIYGLHFAQHLEAMKELTAKPWEVVPDYEKRIETHFDHNSAATAIREIIEAGGLTAFDYETNMLKPDSKQAQIVSCSIHSGKLNRTIAYPWHGSSILATQEYLQSHHPKIASNLKFEERWTKAVFKHGVRNWKWDTMLAAHILDNRTAVSSIKFQSFVWLGHPGYNDVVEPYLKSKGGSNDENSIKQLDTKKLLVYNGMDSLLEYKVAKLQMKTLGIK
jgi:uracil-DNA glycosylase family 4